MPHMRLEEHNTVHPQDPCDLGDVVVPLLATCPGKAHFIGIREQDNCDLRNIRQGNGRLLERLHLAWPELAHERNTMFVDPPGMPNA